jgi:hypothetical protein
MWTVLFWLGFFVLAGHAGVLAFSGAYVTALVALAGALAMFFGSKVGREFLGISAA